MTDVTLKDATANVERLVAELYRASGDLAELATAAANAELATAAAALQQKLVEDAPAEEPAENPFMASHRDFVERIRARRLPRASSVP